MATMRQRRVAKASEHFTTIIAAAPGVRSRLAAALDWVRAEAAKCSDERQARVVAELIGIAAGLNQERGGKQ